MPLINRPYQLKLFHALNIYRDAMRKFIIRQLQQGPLAPINAIRNSLWDSAVAQFDKNFRVDDDLETTIDVGWFKVIIEVNWNLAFDAAFVDEKGRVLSDLDSISDIRNKVVHPKKYDINRSEALNALETIEHILQSVGAIEGKKTVERIRDDSSDGQASTMSIPQYVDVSPAEVQRIAEAVAERVEPLVKRVGPSVDSAEEMKQTLGKRIADELTPVVDSLQLVQGQVVEEIVDRIKPLVEAQQESTQQQMTAKATEEINETLAELLQGFRALETRVTDTLVNPITTAPAQSPPTSPIPKQPSEKVAPSSIADMWLEVIEELRTVKVNALTLGPLLRGCRPTDVWIQRDPEKLILPFRNDFHLNSMKTVSKDHRGKELIDRAIANHFGRALDFECCLDSPLPF